MFNLNWAAPFHIVSLCSDSEGSLSAPLMFKLQITNPLTSGLFLFDGHWRFSLFFCVCVIRWRAAIKRDGNENIFQEKQLR